MVTESVDRKQRPAIAVRLAPVPGEHLRSWLCNCAQLLDVSLAELLDYLDLPDEWAKGDLARGVWIDGRHCADSTATLLKELSSTFEMPLEDLRALLVDAHPNYLRSSKRPYGCPACSARDARVGLLPRIQRHWLLRLTTYCDLHGLPLQYLDRPALPVERGSGPMNDAFVAEIRFGLLLGWDPKSMPASAALFEDFRRRTARVRLAPRRAPTGTWSQRPTVVWLLQRNASSNQACITPLYSVGQLCDIVEDVNPQHLRLVAGEAIGEKSWSGEVAAQTLLEDARVFLERLAVRFGIARRKPAQRLGVLVSRLESTRHLGQARLNDIAKRLKYAAVSNRLQSVLDNAFTPSVILTALAKKQEKLDSLSRRRQEAMQSFHSRAAMRDLRIGLRTDISRVRAVWGPDLVGHAQDLKRVARDYLHAVHLYEFDPACDADMIRLGRACIRGVSVFDRRHRDV